MSEFHRQCVFSALAVVGGVDGKNVFFPSAQLCGVVLSDAVNIDRVDVAQRTEQPFFTELAVVQFHKVHHSVSARVGRACFAILSVALAALIPAFECCLSGAANR